MADTDDQAQAGSHHWQEASAMAGRLLADAIVIEVSRLADRRLQLSAGCTRLEGSQC